MFFLNDKVASSLKHEIHSTLKPVNVEEDELCDCIVVLNSPVITASLLCVMCSTDQQTYYGHINQVSPELRQEVQPHFQEKSTPCFDTRVMCNLM